MNDPSASANAYLLKRLLSRPCPRRQRGARYASELRVDLVEVCLVDQDLARLPAVGGRYQTLHLHHVHEARGAAEADAESPLQVGNGRLSALHHDARRLVVEVVLVQRG